MKNKRRKRKSSLHWSWQLDNADFMIILFTLAITIPILGAAAAVGLEELGINIAPYLCKGC